MTDAIGIGRGKVWAGALGPADRLAIDTLLGRGRAHEAPAATGRRYRLIRRGGAASGVGDQR